jgi:phosphorylcholine metabolism protein LicD
MKLDHHFSPVTKINSKCHEDLNVRPEIIKLLEETGETVQDVGIVKDFFWIFLLPNHRKEKHKCDYIRLKYFCTAKETINRVRRKQNGRKYLRTEPLSMG